MTSPKDPSSAFLTYAWCRSAYIAARSLARAGLRVNVADVSATGMAQWSRYGHFAGCYAPPLTQPEQFMEDILRLLDQTGAGFLLPGHDETEILARRRDSLPAHVILPVAPAATLALANDKDRVASLAEGLGLPVPRRVAWDSLPELTARLENVPGEMVVKLRRGNSAKGVFYPTSPSDAVDLCTRLIEQYHLAPERYPIVQQRVSGEGWGVSCLYWEGQRLASFTHRRLREKTSTGGTSTLRVSAHNPQVEEVAHCLLDALEWHGLAMVEFKYDPQTHQPWLMEINPRLWGSIHLAVASGIDFPAWLYLAATKGPAAVKALVQPWREGVVARWYLGDLIAAAGELKHLRVMRALRMALPGGADTYDDWHWDDPGAFLGQASYYLAALFRSRSLNPVQDGMLG